MVAAPEPPRRRDNGEASGAQHREANKPNSRQALRGDTKASAAAAAAAALPEAEGKKTERTRHGREKSPRSHNHFVGRIAAFVMRALFFFPPSAQRVVKGTAG